MGVRESANNDSEINSYGRMQKFYKLSFSTMIDFSQSLKLLVVVTSFGYVQTIIPEALICRKNLSKMMTFLSLERNCFLHGIQTWDDTWFNNYKDQHGVVDKRN